MAGAAAHIVNSIPSDQNSEPLLKLLRARQQIYRTAVGYQIAQFIATVILPLLAAVGGLWLPDWRGPIGAVVIILTGLDVFWLDREMKRQIKVAAKISEQFDCELLQMPWNSFFAGKRVDAQIVHQASTAWDRNIDTITNWYSRAVGAVPHAEARLICQRLNLGYDSALRRTYGKILLVSFPSIFVVVGLLSYWRGLAALDALVAVLLPLAPLALWSIREYFRQKDAADAVDQIKGEADSFFDKLYANAVKQSDYALRSREFQDALLQRRSQNPLIAPFLYRALRHRLERGMNDTAEEIVRRLDQARSAKQLPADGGASA